MEHMFVSLVGRQSVVGKGRFRLLRNCFGLLPMRMNKKNVPLLKPCWNRHVNETLDLHDAPLVEESNHSHGAYDLGLSECGDTDANGCFC